MVRYSDDTEVYRTHEHYCPMRWAFDDVRCARDDSVISQSFGSSASVQGPTLSRVFMYLTSSLNQGLKQY